MTSLATSVTTSLYAILSVGTSTYLWGGSHFRVGRGCDHQAHQKCKGRGAFW